MKNYKKWYFTLNYPEIIEKYKDEELNSLKLKNGTITLKSGSSWYESSWNTVEGWWDNASGKAEDFWEENGDEIKSVAYADARGAVTGYCTSLGNPQFAAAYAIGTSGYSAVENWY